ncbi:hypothetical protein K2173_002310 [Erythroxylum novogranatense]|uniref:Alpha/beta hydrolase fold-3 domain-containing protein n=1 Tax=Erythroxylum novogranatense TaxID=1862640 RepID=A0AAV8T9S3_9ROSI|nr:hypothetical protein K2173_002310 [Erythroxylum novogranatense]
MSDPEIFIDFSPFFQVYKDGSINRMVGTEPVAPSPYSEDDVRSKDVVFSQEPNLSSRIYLPKHANPARKLPLLVYFHGGAFCMESAFSATYHNYQKTLFQAANVVLVSIEYRLAPEHPLPAAYDDCWTALKWVASHATGNGPEEWLNSFADLEKVFLAGDSAGGNITHNMAMRYGQEKLVGTELKGIALVHSYFWGKDTVGNESSRDPKETAMVEKVWRFTNPDTSGMDDPLINPIADPKFSSLGCSRVLIYVAGNDLFRDRGWLYYEKLSNNGWGGEVEIMESEAEDHCFHLYCDCDNSKHMLRKLVSFLNDDSLVEK